MLNFIEHDLIFTGPLRERKENKFCIFHHTGGGWDTVEEIHAGQIKEHAWIGIGYNLVVYSDGTIHVGRPVNKCDADCYSHNYDSLSVCFIGDFDKNSMTPEQVETGIKIMQWACIEYPGIIGIRHTDLGATTCPGRNFSVRIIMEGMMKVDEPKIKLTWEEIIEKFTNQSTASKAGINAAVGLAESDSNLGELEIFKFLPELIEKIYYSRS